MLGRNTSNRQLRVYAPCPPTLKTDVSHNHNAQRHRRTDRRTTSWCHSRSYILRNNTIG